MYVRKHASTDPFEYEMSSFFNITFQDPFRSRMILTSGSERWRLSSPGFRLFVCYFLNRFASCCFFGCSFIGRIQGPFMPTKKICNSDESLLTGQSDVFTTRPSDDPRFDRVISDPACNCCFSWSIFNIKVHLYLTDWSVLVVMPAWSFPANCCLSWSF